MADFLDAFILDLLHIDDVKDNKLIDIGTINGTVGINSGKNGESFLLTLEGEDSAPAMLRTIKRRIGKLSNNTVLADSALNVTSIVNPYVEKWDWKDLNGVKNAGRLNDFITNVYSEISTKGNNPLFLGVGMLKWKIVVADELETVNSPLLIFPIRLVRGTGTSLVELEFVDDDAYFNPCLIAKLRRDYNEYCYKDFPHPNGQGADFDEPLSLDKLGDGIEYFNKVAAFIDTLKGTDGVENQFEFFRDAVVISQYNHDDLCMYYDVRRNMDIIVQHPLIARVFGQKIYEEAPKYGAPSDVKLILPADSVQQELIGRVVNGESMIIKGPPGTGKTVTIANMIAALIANGKKVLLSSKKLAALSEVHAKLPEELRKFTMLLDAETEKKASKINPESIRKDLKNLLQYKREYKYDNAYSSQYEAEGKKKYAALKDLDKYYNILHTERFGGKTYYEALDAYFAHTDMPFVPFANPIEAARLTASDYELLKGDVAVLSKHMADMSQGASLASRSAWYGIGCPEDVDAMISDAEKIADAVDDALRLLKKTASRYVDVPINSLSVAEIINIVGNRAFSREELVKLMQTPTRPFTVQDIKDRIEKFKDAQCEEELMFDFGDLPLELLPSKADAKDWDVDLTLQQLLKINDKLYLLKSASGAPLDDVILSKMRDAAVKIFDLTVKSRAAEIDAKIVFDLEIGQKQEKLLLASYDDLSPYFEQGENSKFGFGAKSAFKKLSKLSSDRYLTEQKLLKAVKAYKEYFDASRAIETYTRLMNTCLGRTLTEQELDALCLILTNSAQKGVEVKDYADLIVKCVAKLKPLLAKMVVKNDNCTIAQFIKAYEAHKARILLNNAVEKCCAAAETKRPEDLLEAARGIIVAYRLSRFEILSGKDEHANEHALDALFDIDVAIKEPLSIFVESVSKFAADHFSNYYTDNVYELTVDEVSVYRDQLKNRTVLNAALSYYDKIEKSKQTLDLSSLFEPIAEGETSCSFEDIPACFEFSFSKLILDAHKMVLKKDNVGLGSLGTMAFDAIDEADRKIRYINVKRIENLCLSRIDLDDPDYDFLAVDKGARMTTRGLFRNYSSALLKMKRCFILSPSTVSVMFRGKEYFDFDVVIIDEASQLEPVNILPILMRSKQCVLVGDEFQMPPIAHFKAKNNEVLIDYDKELEIDKDISALSLALENLAFDTAELVCHYRSKTESLIAFSQREFYPNMRTFPAAIPFKKGIGFEDVYVENANCKNGVNEAEALMVVECLKKHFDDYYTEGHGLSRSVGVVAFGEAQLKRILKLIELDAELYRKRQNAIEKFDDTADKIIFFRTIETVQGQETDHLILSLTYGRDANGKPQNRFGELNRDALGKCIFNVAVTRAKDMVTLVHSVHPYELDSTSRIGFIVDYIRLVERFAHDDKTQFVTSKLTSGANFVEDVAKYIESLGINRSRIAVNYGVTDGSVRIPIAILNRSLNEALLGIWCELPTGKKYDYIDYNIGYYNSLKERGWNLKRLSIHDWYENSEAEKNALGKAISTLYSK